MNHEHSGVAAIVAHHVRRLLAGHHTDEARQRLLTRIAQDHYMTDEQRMDSECVSLGVLIGGDPWSARW